MKKWDIRFLFTVIFALPKDFDAVAYTLYGGAMDLEPPEEQYECGKCWNKEEDHTLTERVSWMGPSKLFVRCKELEEEQE